MGFATRTTRPLARRRRFVPALVLTAAAAAVAVLPGVASAATSAKTVVQASGRLTDLRAAGDPTDGATARFYAFTVGNQTTAILVLNGLPLGSVGQTFGVHVHTGSCVVNMPTTAGPHYNTGGPASVTTEVWLDFTVQPGGFAISNATVPFTIPQGGASAVVIHALPTGVGGAAGPRIACLPVAF